MWLFTLQYYHPTASLCDCLHSSTIILQQVYVIVYTQVLSSYSKSVWLFTLQYYHPIANLCDSLHSSTIIL